MGLFLGIVVGFFLPAFITTRSSRRPSAEPAPSEDEDSFSSDSSPFVYSGRLKFQCDCGHVGELLEDDSLLSFSDTFTCTECGKTHDVSRIRHMIGEATAGF